MNTAQESATNVVPSTKIGAMMHLAPRTTLTDETSTQELADACEECLQKGDIHLVIDMGSVQGVNSTSLEMLLSIHDRAIRVGGWVKLTHVNPVIQDILILTRFTRYISLLDNQKPHHIQRSQTPQRLGDILVSKGILTENRVNEAIELQKKTSRRIGQIIIDKDWASENEVLDALSEQLSIPYVRLRSGIFDPAIASLVKKSTANRLRVLPLQKVRDTIYLATGDPQAIPAFDEIEQQTGFRVQPVLARREDIFRCLNDAYSGNTNTLDLIGDVDEDFEVVENSYSDDYAAIDEMAEGSPVINLVNSLVQRAIRDGASDIHIEPSRSKSRVRCRIDGVLYEITSLRSELHPAIVSRLKVMANLDIAERRLPQDGRIQVHTQGRTVDLRFSSLPGLFGEKVVLRVLDKNHSLLDINKLGMSASNLETFKSLLNHSNGLILVTGPTGSGKTTSLYAALNHLNSIEKNIVTIEDPVEYQIDIVNQNEVHDKIGLSFSSILRHTLRQDPDIVMVGEIRDRETAEIAVQAALTGHLVLSTLHTNHAIGAVTRMIDMDVEPYLLSSALIGVVAQRLVRTNCPACKTTYLASPEVVQRYNWDSERQIHLARGRGCTECYDSGFKGRMGIHEILAVTEDLQRLITTNPGRDELNRYIKENNIKTLFEDGLNHARDGETTIEEISRVINV